MFEVFSLVKFLILQGAGLVIALIAAGLFVYLVLRKLHSSRITLFLFFFFFGTCLLLYVPMGIPSSITYPFGLKTYGPAEGPWLPLKNVFTFFRHVRQFERVADIARDPNVTPAPLRAEGEEVSLHLTTKEVLAEIAPGVVVNYWTFDGTVPGPMLRVREGDMVHVTLSNDSNSLHHHSVDFHAVTGPGGGGVATYVAPGESKDFRFRALNPGLYVYHCAAPNVANHMAHGMYGMILVEPKEGLPQVDKEFYVMQGEVYTAGKMGTQGLQVIDTEKMLSGNAEYIIFNGRVGGLNGKMTAATGEKVRIYFGNGGVSDISSFHVIGEIFDTVYPEASIGGALLKNVQTTLVPAGGATIVEFGLEVPGRYILVDHALSRLDRGAWGVLEVTGTENREVFDAAVDPQVAATPGH
ncbi:MAG: copper-containing nitrite reductase [Candidatus Moranbacteria bacterium]|nr:copper-containing nitrite reductase [Candidatus Moranbacteria bacterium]